MYRARRYRLTRTIWRGVRFWMTGSGWSYAWRAGLWTLLVIVTLGLALPWYQAALERYKMTQQLLRRSARTLRRHRRRAVSNSLVAVAGDGPA